MSGPTEIVLQRHGFTEANAVQRADKLGLTLPEHEAVYARHDSEQRLAWHALNEAGVAAENLLENGLDPSSFDERFVSSLLRAIESAVEFAPDCTWLPSMSLVERDWGASGATPTARRNDLFPDSVEQLRRSAFYGRHALGESVHDLIFRIRDWMDLLHREHNRQRVWAIAHGETMSAAMCVIERWMPHEWEAFEQDPAMTISNWSIIHYTRTDPTDPSITVESMSSGWRRMIDAVDPSCSPNGGAWVRLGGKRRLDAETIRSMLADTPRLINGGVPDEILPAARRARR